MYERNTNCFSSAQFAVYNKHLNLPPFLLSFWKSLSFPSSLIQIPPFHILRPYFDREAILLWSPPWHWLRIFRPTCLLVPAMLSFRMAFYIYSDFWILSYFLHFIGVKFSAVSRQFSSVNVHHWPWPWSLTLLNSQYGVCIEEVSVFYRFDETNWF